MYGWHLGKDGAFTEHYKIWTMLLKEGSICHTMPHKSESASYFLAGAKDVYESFQ